LEWIVKAAEAVKHVLCEKPIVMTAAEAETAIAASIRHGVKLIEGFMYRFHSKTKREQELLTSGTVGQIKEVRAHLSVDIMNPADSENVLFKPALGGGSLYEMGCYAVNVSRMVFDTEPKHAFVRFGMDEKFRVDRNSHRDQGRN
jgi:D-xylose 1-dehydrogenase (NADP+, D-xylono-1,5-lactone-forming)